MPIPLTCAYPACSLVPASMLTVTALTTKAQELRTSVQWPIPFLQCQHHLCRPAQQDRQRPCRKYVSSSFNTEAHANVLLLFSSGRYAKFKTRKGRKVTAFGVLYNFAGNDKNTTVQTVANMVKEPWVGSPLLLSFDTILISTPVPGGDQIGARPLPSCRVSKYALLCRLKC